MSIAMPWPKSPNYVARKAGRLATWDIEQGLRQPGQAKPSADSAAGDPLAAIRSLHSLAGNVGTGLLVLTNLHRFLGSAEIVQALIHQITAGKHSRTFVIVLSPVVQIPTELEKLIVVIEHDLPGRDQLEQIARSIATQEGELPDGPQLATVLDASAGLTRYEAEAAYSLSLVRQGCIAADAIWELKTGMLKKSGLLSLASGEGRLHEPGRAGCSQSLL